MRAALEEGTISEKDTGRPRASAKRPWQRENPDCANSRRAAATLRPGAEAGSAQRPELGLVSEASGLANPWKTLRTRLVRSTPNDTAWRKAGMRNHSRAGSVPGA